MPLREPLFSELIQRVDGERGMRRKMRLLAGSWSQLRELSPEQREHLALAVGNRWAWRNIESLFGNPSQLSDNQREVKEFFESMRETDPKELRTIGREIKDGKFVTAQGRVMSALEEALEEENEGEGDSPEPVESAPEPSRPARPVRQEVAAPVIEIPPSKPDAPEPPPPKSVETPSVTPPPAKATSPAAVQADREKPEPEPEPATEPEPEREAKPKSELKPETKSGPVVSAVEPTPGEDRRIDRIRRKGTALSAVESLRVLRRLSDGEVSSTRAGRAAMVRSLTSGWAARRAVSAIIRSSSIDDLDEALTLIRQLPTATQQTWCLGDLVHYWDLDDAALARVLAVAPTEPARNRLAKRVERAV